VSDHTARVVGVVRSATSDRHIVVMVIGGKNVRLFLNFDHLAPLTKVDLTPNAPYTPEWASPPAPAGETSSEPEAKVR
jgi:hypothetical protein